MSDRQPIRSAKVLREVDTRQAAEREDVANGVAAQAVRTVDAARDFADSEEARNHLVVAVKHLVVEVDANAAHRVVHGHAGVAGPERSLVDLRQVARGLAHLVLPRQSRRRQ